MNSRPQLRLASDGGVTLAPGVEATREAVPPPVSAPIILLQGPVGGFFGAFARYIRSEYGIPVLKVQYNLGDIVCDRCDWTVSYNGAQSDLAAWYRQLFLAHMPRAVVVFGDERPVHRIARDIATAMNIPFFSFEEGYMRPNFVTLEHYGNNANSLLADAAVPAVIPFKSAPQHEHYGSNVVDAAWRASLYFVSFAAGRSRFKRYIHHRHRGMAEEIAKWVWCFVQNKTRRKAEIATSVDIAERQAGSYFVLALQVYDDLQLLSHGRDWSAETLITQALHSFARFAPAGARLIIKQHPLDTGHRNYARLIAETAVPLGISDRVVYLRFANLQLLLQNASGLVTVNSTAGINALSLGCPVITMGDSLYAREGLAVDGVKMADLDRFWQKPRPVDRPLFTRFKASLIARTQINGDFYISKAWPRVFKVALARILHEAEHLTTSASTSDSDRHGIRSR